MKELTFGSLFAGVGGFDMGMEAAGWDCKFQVEWDKNCQNILKKNWPDVPKWGDVSEVNGALIPPVDCIVFGSPCQDLSVAGKRAGLEGARSGLFHEATRIIKEMRYATNGTFPRWAIWENVAGALSSNRGADFATVLHQMGEAGAVDQWWNILDAQFFGVPQRRRRLFLVACFDPATAARCPETLLPVSESLPGHLAKSKPQRKGSSNKITDSVRADGEWWDGQSTAATLTRKSNDQRMPDKGHLPVVIQEAPILIDRAAFNQGPNAKYDTHISDDPIVPTLVARGPHAVFTKSRHAQSSDDDETWVEGEINPTLNAFETGDTRTTTAVIYANVVGPLTSRSGSSPRGSETSDSAHVILETVESATAYKFDALSSNSMKSSNPDSGVNEVNTAPTLDTWRPDPSLNQGGLAIVEPMLIDGTRVNDVRVYSEPVQTLKERMGTGGNNVPMLAVTYSFDTQFGSNANVTENIAPTLKASQQSPSIAYPIQDGREIEKHQNGLGVADENAPAYTLDSTGSQAVAYSIREDAKANTFSATELDHANSLSALRPSPQSHHAQMFITEPTVFQPGTMVRLGGGIWEGTVPTLRAEAKRGDNEPHIQLHNAEPTMAVRRLTPLECERLMGWPDDHTRWTAEGKEQADSHRYKQCGNGVASPVAKWIGKQIAKVEHE